MKKKKKNGNQEKFDGEDVVENRKSEKSVGVTSQQRIRDRWITYSCDCFFHRRARSGIKVLRSEGRLYFSVI
jgi:hypothetical protein